MNLSQHYNEIVKKIVALHACMVIYELYSTTYVKNANLVHHRYIERYKNATDIVILKNITSELHIEHLLGRHTSKPGLSLLRSSMSVANIIYLQLCNDCPDFFNTYITHLKNK